MTVERGASWRGRLRRALASIRVRFVVGYVLLLTVALGIAVVVTRQVELARADVEIERQQVQEVEELRRLAAGTDPATGQPFGTDVAALFDTFLQRNVPSDDEAFYTLVAGEPYLFSFGSPRLFADPQFAAAWTVETPTSWTTTSDTDDVGEVHSLAVPLVSADGVGGVFVVASFPGEDHREVRQIVRVITLTGVGLVAVTAVLAWSLAGRVLRPVRELTSTARGITESDLSARIPVEGHDELAQLGTTFNEMVDRLEHGFAAQRRFLDDVAHELRTPITIARGHLEMLGDDPAERVETVEIVTDELDRMSRYVTDLLLLAKAEQPDFLVPEAVDARELAESLYQRVGALGDRRWVLDATPPPGLVVWADPERLGQAVANLVANAVQHTTPGAEIGVGVAPAGANLRLWVRDTGPGVDPAVADALFDRYSRAATSRTRRPEGTGIGLSIVDAIARAHGGAVTVASEPGRGATFVISIPMTATTWAPPTVGTEVSP